MKIKQWHSGILALGLLVLTLAGCHPKVGAPPAPAERTDIRTFLDQGPYRWEWFACSGTAEITSSIFSGTGQYALRMKKDSILWVAIRFIGIEVARIQADRDSMVILNRFEKTVDAYTWEEVTKRTGFPASLEAVQRTVLGWLPIIPSGLQVMESDDRSMQVIGKEGPIQMSALLAEPDLIPLSCQFRDTGSGSEAEGTQTMSQDARSGQVPPERSWDMRQDGESRLFLRVNVQDPSFTGPLSFPFDIPDRYARHR